MPLIDEQAIQLVMSSILLFIIGLVFVVLIREVYTTWKLYRKVNK